MVYENIPHDFNLKLSQRPDLTFDYDYYIANTISTPVRLPFFTRVLIFSVNIFFRLTGLFFPARQRDLFRRLANCIQNFESSGLETLRLNKEMRSGLAEVYGRRIEYPNIHKPYMSAEVVASVDIDFNLRRHPVQSFVYPEDSKQLSLVASMAEYVGSIAPGAWHEQPHTLTCASQGWPPIPLSASALE